MKNLLLVLLTLWVATSCEDTKENQMILAGSIDGLKKGTLFLEKFEDTTWVAIDSIQMTGAPEFLFEVEVPSPEMYYLSLKSEGEITKERIGVFAEAGEINVTSSLKKFGLDAVITGSSNQEILNQYSTLIKRYTDKNLELIEASVKAIQEGKDSLSLSLQQQQNKLLASKYLATVNFAVNNGDSEVAPYLMLTEVYDVNTKYLDTVYNALTPTIKDSKYGKMLQEVLDKRNNQ